MRSRNEPLAKPLTSWLVPSFSQHNLHLVVLERCLHVSVMKFWDQFVSLRQVNTPSSWDKFQNCCTDMYLIRFLPVRISRYFACFCEFRAICLDFAAPRPREISEALSLAKQSCHLAQPDPKVMYNSIIFNPYPTWFSCSAWYIV